MWNLKLYKPLEENFLVLHKDSLEQQKHKQARSKWISSILNLCSAKTLLKMKEATDWTIFAKSLSDPLYIPLYPEYIKSSQDNCKNTNPIFKMGKNSEYFTREAGEKMLTITSH